MSETHDQEVRQDRPATLCACSGACLGRDDGGCQRPATNGNVNGGQFVAWDKGTRPAVSVGVVSINGAGTRGEGRGRPVGSKNRKAAVVARVRPHQEVNGRALQRARLALLGVKGYSSPLVENGVAVSPKVMPKRRRRGMEPEPATVVIGQLPVHEGLGRPSKGSLSLRDFNDTEQFRRRWMRLQNL